MTDLLEINSEDSSSPSCTDSFRDLSVPSSSDSSRDSSSSSTGSYSAVLKFPPCVICSGRATGLHYGCNTCEACKNFFRRCLARKKGYKCVKNNSCTILYKEKICPACRWEKCMQNGMSKDRCKMGRYSYERRTEAIKMAQHMENTSFTGDDVTIVADSIKKQDLKKDTLKNETILLNEGVLLKLDIEINCDKTTVDMMVNRMNSLNLWGDKYVSREARYAKIAEHFENYKLKIEKFGQMNAISMEEYQTLLKNFGIDLDGQWEIFKNSVVDCEEALEKYCKFVRNIPGFNQLSFSDQSNLLKCTHCEFFMIVMHDGYSEDLNVAIDINGYVYHMDEVADKFLTRQLMVDFCTENRILQRLNLTDTEMALLLCMVTMSSDRCELENPELVNKAQLCFTDLLLRDLQSRMSHAAAIRRFSKFIDMFVRLRNITMTYNREYRRLCNDEFITKSIPNIDCVLPSEDC